MTSSALVDDVLGGPVDTRKNPRSLAVSNFVGSNINNLGILRNSVGFGSKNAGHHGSVGTDVVIVSVDAESSGNSSAKVWMVSLDARVDDVGKEPLCSSILVGESRLPRAATGQ